ncbi:hypothetical protein OIU76_017823 [Salix suchowensis]|nr:hypothetical protein OIU76_017823 [Salix suchowensis]
MKPLPWSYSPEWCLSLARSCYTTSSASHAGFTWEGLYSMVRG